jgi:aspartyl protease family protein
LRRRFLWFLLALLLIGLLVLVSRNADQTIAGLLSQSEFAVLIYQIALVVLVGALVLAMFRERFFQALEAALIWMAIGLLLVLGYTYRLDLRDVGERILAELLPGRAVTVGRAVEIARGRGGSFAVDTRVNGAHVSMVLDTGASAVVLTQEAAKAAGLPLEILAYSVAVETANGRTHAAPVTLDRVAIGGITERKVPALIAQPGQLKTSLLGMSFLDRLDRWEVRGDRLVLRGKP